MQSIWIYITLKQFKYFKYLILLDFMQALYSVRECFTKMDTDSLSYNQIGNSAGVNLGTIL